MMKCRTQRTDVNLSFRTTDAAYVHGDSQLYHIKKLTEKKNNNKAAQNLKPMALGKMLTCYMYSNNNTY